MVDAPGDIFIDLVFSIIQTAMFFFSGIFLLLGVLLLIFPLLPARGDRRVKATIVAIRAGSGKNFEAGAKDMYYPIYEYIDEHGQSVRAESDWGSSTLTDKIIGTQVQAKVNPAHPNKIKTFSVMLLVLSLFFIGAGAGLGYASSSYFDITPYTFLLGGLGVVILCFKINKIIIPKERRKKPEEFVSESTLQRQGMPVLERNQVNRIIGDHIDLAKKAAPVLAAIGLLLCGGSYYIAAPALNLHRGGMATTGSVIDYERVTDSEGDRFYQPRIEYTDDRQVAHVFTDKFGSKLRRYEIGSRVPILYLPDGQAMISNNYLRWIIPGFLAFCGLMSFVSAFSVLNKSRRF